MLKQRFTELSGTIETLLSKQIFFICGAPKSGTTWLQRLFDSHPEIVCSGEGHFADKVAEPLSKLFSAYNNHYRLVTERVYQGKPYYRPLEKDQFEYAVVAVSSLMMAQRGLNEGTKCIGDKTPRYCFYLPALNSLFEGAKFIHIIRDGRDTAVSVLHHANRAGIKGVLDKGSEAFNRQLAAAADHWKENVLAARRFGEKEPEIYWEVQYENLLSDPEKALKDLFKFLGVDVSASTIFSCIESSAFKKWSGREQGEEKKDSFFRKGVSGDWRNYLDDEALGLFLKKAGGLLASLGYGE